MTEQPHGERPPNLNLIRDPRAMAFEMIYGISWDKLPFSRPENLPILAAYFPQEIVMQRRFKGAYDRDEDFALRVIMPFQPDKLLFYILLNPALNLAGSRDQPNFVQDLLKQNEKFTGAVLGRVAWWNYSIPSLGGDTINILGVSDKKDNPRGLIYYRTGKNPPKRKVVESILDLGNLSPQMLSISNA